LYDRAGMATITSIQLYKEDYEAYLGPFQSNTYFSFGRHTGNRFSPTLSYLNSNNLPIIQDNTPAVKFVLSTGHEHIAKFDFLHKYKEPVLPKINSIYRF
jgi:hypothetical protein